MGKKRDLELRFRFSNLEARLGNIEERLARIETLLTFEKGEKGVTHPPPWTGQDPPWISYKTENLTDSISFEVEPVGTTGDGGSSG